MDLLNKTDEEIIEIANPIWDNLVRASNQKDYGGFTRDFSSQMLFDKLVNNLLLAHCFPNSTSLAPNSICDEKSLVKPP